MDGGAHQPDAHGAAPVDQLGQLRGPEALEAGPEPDVGIRRHLRLHAHQPFDGRFGGEPPPLQQELPRQQRAIEGARAEDVA